MLCSEPLCYSVLSRDGWFYLRSWSDLKKNIPKIKGSLADVINTIDNDSTADNNQIFTAYMCRNLPNILGCTTPLQIWSSTHSLSKVVGIRPRLWGIKADRNLLSRCVPMRWWIASEFIPSGVVVLQIFVFGRELRNRRSCMWLDSCRSMSVGFIWTVCSILGRHSLNNRLARSVIHPHLRP